MIAVSAALLARNLQAMTSWLRSCNQAGRVMVGNSHSSGEDVCWGERKAGNIMRTLDSSGENAMLLKQSLLPSVITSMVALVTFGMNPVTAQNISAGTASKKSVNQLIELARSNSPDLREAIRSSFDPKQLAAGTAWLEHGHDFFFATEAAATPELFIDGRRGPVMHPAGASLWYAAPRIEGLGKPHSFSYQVA